MEMIGFTPRGPRDVNGRNRTPVRAYVCVQDAASKPERCGDVCFWRLRGRWRATCRGNARAGGRHLAHTTPPGTAGTAGGDWWGGTWRGLPGDADILSKQASKHHPYFSYAHVPGLLG